MLGQFCILATLEIRHLYLSSLPSPSPYQLFFYDFFTILPRRYRILLDGGQFQRLRSTF